MKKLVKMLIVGLVGVIAMIIFTGCGKAEGWPSGELIDEIPTLEEGEVYRIDENSKRKVDIYVRITEKEFEDYCKKCDRNGFVDENRRENIYEGDDGEVEIFLQNMPEFGIARFKVHD